MCAGRVWVISRRRIVTFALSIGCASETRVSPTMSSEWAPTVTGWLRTSKRQSRDLSAELVQEVEDSPKRKALNNRASAVVLSDVVCRICILPNLIAGIEND